jgi:hypothetical protein
MRIVSDSYQHLGAKLLAEVLDEQDRPVFHWADLWYEQTDFPEVAEGIDYPAVFFEFGAEDIATLGQLEQDVKLYTSIYVAVDSLQDTAINSPERGDGLHYLEVCARVHELLQGYEHTSCGSLTRVGFDRYNARTNVIVYRLTYASQVADTSATDVRRVTEPATPTTYTLAPKRTFDI